MARAHTTSQLLCCGFSQCPILRIEKGLNQLLLAFKAAFIPERATALAVIESSGSLEQLRPSIKPTGMMMHNMMGGPTGYHTRRQKFYYSPMILVHYEDELLPCPRHQLVGVIRVGIDKDDDVVLGAPYFIAGEGEVRDRSPLFWRFFNPLFYALLFIVDIQLLGRRLLERHVQTSKICLLLLLNLLQICYRSTSTKIYDQFE